MAAAKKGSKKKLKLDAVRLALIGGGVFSACLLVIFIILVLLPAPFYEQGFETFAELNVYTSSTEELVPLESDNAVKPDFSKFYSRYKPGIMNSLRTSLSRIAVALGLKNRPPFSPSFFKTIVESSLKIRTEKGYKKKCIDKLQVPPGAEFIVWGDLQGALHSLTLDLNKLKELGYFDENFKLIKPNTFIILLGNIVDRTPYSLETVALILRIIERNPDRVLYTKGSHETDGYWLEHTLKTEMQLRLSHLSEEKVPLKKEMMEFFDTVTHVSYLQAADNGGNCFVRISRLERQKFKDQSFAQFLLTKAPQQLSVFSWQTKGTPPIDPAQPQVEVKAVLKIEKKRETYQPTEGLRMMEPEMGATAWTLISCPTPAYEKALKFYNDTFAILRTAAKIDQWTIELYYQDRRDRSGFKTKKFNFISGRDITGQSTQAAPAPQTAPAVQATQTSPAAPAAPAAQAQAAQKPAAQPAQVRQAQQPAAQPGQQATPVPAPKPAQPEAQQQEPASQTAPQAASVAQATQEVPAASAAQAQAVQKPAAQPAQVQQAQQPAQPKQPVAQPEQQAASAPAPKPAQQAAQQAPTSQPQAAPAAQATQTSPTAPAAPAVQVQPAQKPATQPVQAQQAQQPTQAKQPATQSGQQAALAQAPKPAQPAEQQESAPQQQPQSAPAVQASPSVPAASAVQAQAAQKPSAQPAQVQQAQQPAQPKQPVAQLGQQAASVPASKPTQPAAQQQESAQSTAQPAAEPSGLQPAPPGM